MKRFRITEIATGKVVYEYQADEQLALLDWPATDFAQAEMVDAAPTGPAYSGSWRITKLAFRNRFTQTEKVMIEIASLDNAAAPMAQRQLAAALRAYEADVATATFIDLKRTDTRSGVQALEAYGLLAAGRATVILDTVPTDEELFK